MNRTGLSRCALLKVRGPGRAVSRTPADNCPALVSKTLRQQRVERCPAFIVKKKQNPSFLMQNPSFLMQNRANLYRRAPILRDPLLRA